MNDNIDFADAIRLMQTNSNGAHIGKVMKEGGCLMTNGVMRFFTPAPPWVFRCMSMGINVEFGAWCRTATAKMQQQIDALMPPKPPEPAIGQDN